MKGPELKRNFLGKILDKELDSKELQDWGEHSGAGRMGVALISYWVPARPAAPWDTPWTEMSPAWVGHIGLGRECIWRESSESCVRLRSLDFYLKTATAVQVRRDAGLS